VGLIDDYKTCVGIGSANEGDRIFLIGTHGDHLGQSLYLRELLGREDGPPPPVDLTMEKLHGEFVRASIRSGYITACHDLSDGGFAIAIAEMCIACSLGADITINTDNLHAALFGEDQSRYIVSVKNENPGIFPANAESAGISIQRLGTFQGDTLAINDTITLSVTTMRAANENWLPDYMSDNSATEVN